ncbi:MAG: UDP-glucose 4-epimerase GalE [Alphaproteobacteria bacterium]|nr:UDP-glucose 4-epimerase GalE [Alphaproteobacteria bacterium]MBU2270009.1 UDP-glucose 4-epimerase GalE [Alphaproteobacteria bacterium]MBU2417852.1 UDP-glucose 4-epimerase GalE [Alphaproteobacteria bacterium]
MTRAVLVTGGAGYIGSHTCKALRTAGYTPVTFDNLSLGSPEFVKWGPLVRGDTRDPSQVEAALLAHDVCAVIHFAALSSVGESVSDPAIYYRTNVGGLMGLLEGMSRAVCNTIVFSSTAAVYGEPERVPIAETDPTRPMNAYGRSKLMCEDILRDHAAAYGLKAIALRYFNASGADPETEIGEFREVETHLIPRALMALQGYVHDFQVFGSDFPTADGTAIRDYIHVSDLADAHVRAVTALLSGADGGVFNLGAGRGYSVGEVLTEIGRVTGRSMAAPTGGRRQGDPVQLVADPGLAEARLGFQPTRSSLQSIVESAWRWHLRAHPLRNDIA